MKTEGIKVYSNLSDYQKDLVNSGFILMWEVIDCDQERVFESRSLDVVKTWATNNPEKSSYITKYVLE